MYSGRFFSYTSIIIISHISYTTASSKPKHWRGQIWACAANSTLSHDIASSASTCMVVMSTYKQILSIIKACAYAYVELECGCGCLVGWSLVCFLFILIYTNLWMGISSNTLSRAVMRLLCVIKLLLIAHCPTAHSRFDPNAPPRFRVLSREQLGLAGGFIKAVHDYVFKTAQQSLTTANYSQQ